MDLAAWLRDFAFVFVAAAAVAALLALRTAPVAAFVGRCVAAVAGWTPRTALVVILLATIVPRAAGLALFEPRFESDVREYVEKAALLADGATPIRQELRPDGKYFYRPLGSSLALAGWYRLTGTRGLTSARVHGIALACAAAWLLVVLGRTIGRETWGRVAALGYAGLLHHAAFATIPYTETFVTALVLGASVLFERVRRDLGGWRAAIGLGLLLGWIAITRTELAVLAALAVALLLWERRGEIGAALALSGVLLAAVAVPFAVNATLRSGYPGTLRTSMQGGLILYFGNNPIEVTGFGNAPPAVDARVRELYQRDPSGALARDEALAWMSDHPGEVVRNAAKKAWWLWLAEPQGLGWHAGAGAPPAGLDTGLSRVLRHVAWLQSLALLAAGVLGWRLLGTERRLWCWALWAHLAIWCLLAASPRNRYPLEGWLLLGAAAWVSGTAIAASARAGLTIPADGEARLHPRSRSPRRDPA